MTAQQVAKAIIEGELDRSFAHITRAMDARRDALLTQLRAAHQQAVVLADGEAVDACGLLLDAVAAYLTASAA